MLRFLKTNQLLASKLSPNIKGVKTYILVFFSILY